MYICFSFYYLSLLFIHEKLSKYIRNIICSLEKICHIYIIFFNIAKTCAIIVPLKYSIRICPHREIIFLKLSHI